MHRPAVTTITGLPIITRCVVARTGTHLASAEFNGVVKDMLDKAKRVFHFLSSHLGGR